LLFHPGLDKHWYTVRSPLKPFHTVDPSKSTITVHGGAYTLAMDECVSMLLRKQEAFAVDWEVKLDFRPTTPGEEAGIVAWNRKEAYAALGLRRDEANQMNLLFHTPSISEVSVLSSLRVP
jgi:beta-xylosidase